MRIAFFHWALEMIRNATHFFKYVLSSDEAKFYSDRQLNRHNCHYWSNGNPHWYRPLDHQNRWSIMAWCGIVNGYLIGPYFFEQNVDSATRQRMWLQQNGAAPHYALIVCAFLNEF